MSVTDDVRRRRKTRLADWINGTDAERAWHRSEDFHDAMLIVEYMLKRRGIADEVLYRYGKLRKEQLAKQERERALAERRCEGCGVTFRAWNRRDTRHCSAACRQRAYRARLRDAA